MTKRGMFPNTSQKQWPSADMPYRKKMIICMGVIILTLMFFAFRSNDSEHYLAMRHSMDEYETLLRESKEQMLDGLKMCRKTCRHMNQDLPIIYVITPTYARPVQKAELTRLSHTLMLASNIHWIVVEDAPYRSTLVENLLLRTSLNYTHLFAPTPENYKRKASEPNWHKPRGVEQRNTALRWLRSNMNPETDNGVVYFADDDNSYSLQVFEEMRGTEEVSVWPVGLVGGLLVEKPILNTTTGKVIGWNSAWRPDRPFPIDMAGFAINLRHLLRHPSAEFSFNVSGGFQESVLLQKLTTTEKLEAKADNCTKVLVWHTRTEAPKLTEEMKLRRLGLQSDKGMEV